tara:strand:- start:3446 stop:4051 length:606 start_codon:yes stop_codon:yes gene_type:complete
MKPIFIEKFLPEEILNLCHNYCLLKYNNQADFIEDSSGSIIKEFADPLMETLLDMSTPVIEQNVGKKLWPTYSFLRIYDKGADLPVHVDRPACEYTVALCLGANPTEKPYEIYIGHEDNDSDYQYIDNTKQMKHLKKDYTFPMLPNNAVLFQGQTAEALHWREKCLHDYYITVFIHYVDQNGKHKEWKFDKRESLGDPDLN